MGMKDWLKKQQQKLEGKLNKEPTPDEQKAAKKEEAKKTVELTMKAVKLAKQGFDQYKKVSKTVEDVKDKAAEKTIDLAEKAKPIAEKIDSAAKSLTDKAKSLFKKPEGDKGKGNGIIDLIVPPAKKDEKKPDSDSPKP
jgi:S-adenosylmethionine synthetase